MRRKKKLLRRWWNVLAFCNLCGEVQRFFVSNGPSRPHRSVIALRRAGWLEGEVFGWAGPGLTYYPQIHTGVCPTCRKTMTIDSGDTVEEAILKGTYVEELSYHNRSTTSNKTDDALAGDTYSIEVVPV